MKHLIEKISILSLSLMLVSTFAVSPALPQMIAYFGKQGYAAEQVEFLMTITSFAIMVTLLLNDVFCRILSKRGVIVAGLVLMAVGGSMPAFLSSYPLVFASRVLLGLGIGFINAHAIQLVSLRYTGKERMTTMGLRGSAEVLGSAGLTALVGILIGFGWQAAFLVYLFALVILSLYVLFVPEIKETATQTSRLDPVKMDSFHWKIGLLLALLAYVVIVTNTSLTIRIPVLVTAAKMGTASQASFVLSLMQLMGIVAGISFGPLMGRLGRFLLPISYLWFAAATFLISKVEHLPLLALGAMVLGFLYSVILTIVFHSGGEYTHPSLAQKVMTIILMGCNIGGATSSILPNWLDKVLPVQIGAIGFLAVLSLSIGILLLFRPLPER